MITIVSFIVVLGVLVFFHELGHYLVARRNGIEVDEFGMGYPPRLLKLFTYDGTDFTLNLIPFGGFARMKGEDAADLSPGSFNAAGRGARAATLVAGPAMNAILAVVLFAASFMAGFPAMAGYPRVTQVSTGSVAAQVGVQPNDILLQLAGSPVRVSAIADFHYDLLHKPASVSAGNGNLAVSRDGKILELPVPATVSAKDLLAGVDYAPVLITQISLVAKDTPAERANLQSGDLVYSVNDTIVSANLPLNEIIKRHLGKEVSMTVLRDQKWITVHVTPRVSPPQGQGSLGVEIGPVSTLATLPPLQALWRGILSTGDYILVVLQLPVLLLMGQLSPSAAQVTGPVGIAQMVGGAVTATIDTGLWFPIWRLSAVLSAALAVTNLLPVPALDGGRLLFIVFEVLRGRRVNPEREGLIHMVGFVLLLGLLALVTVRDITTTQQGIDWRTLLGQ